ncbi:hypothetical protein CERSUDRAFT_91149 [Gelatoporia subvermispora B]|uniref:Zn(2)-C6 fungal-type domain-containing protein n=1 Tax=Ceriporiopsis subvermispora (strain B) TaxID=914234 RepID=M2PUM7_CERS8|nr:hypothetical protein CERSUDRAFT_91149 [Gelatoporia subvermispora B]
MSAMYYSQPAQVGQLPDIFNSTAYSNMTPNDEGGAGTLFQVVNFNGVLPESGGSSFYQLESTYPESPTDFEFGMGQEAVGYHQGGSYHAPHAVNRPLASEPLFDIAELPASFHALHTTPVPHSDGTPVMSYSETMTHLADVAVSPYDNVAPVPTQYSAGPTYTPTVNGYNDVPNHTVLDASMVSPQAITPPDFIQFNQNLPGPAQQQSALYRVTPPDVHIYGQQITGRDGTGQWVAPVVEAPLHEMYASNTRQGFAAQPEMGIAQQIALDQYYESDESSPRMDHMHYPISAGDIPPSSNIPKVTALPYTSRDGTRCRRVIYSPKTGRPMSDLPPVDLPQDVPVVKKRGKRGRITACLFCRRRKIQCRGPIPGNPDKTCIQCERRKQADDEAVAHSSEQAFGLLAN